MASSDVFGLEAFELLLVAKFVGLELKRAELAGGYATEGFVDRIVIMASYHCQGSLCY